MSARLVTLTAGTAMAAVLAAGPVAAAAHPKHGFRASSERPAAAGWLIDVTMLSGPGTSLQVAAVRADHGPQPEAWGSALSVNGHAYAPALATVQRPNVATHAFSYTDPSSTLSASGGYARASVAAEGSSATTGFLSGSGNSFSMASQLLTWKQQSQLTGEAAALNDAIFDPLDAKLRALAPVFTLAGLQVPQLAKMTPLALINMGSGDGVTATAKASSGAGLSSASVSVALADLQLLDGFIQLDGVHGTATSEDVDGAISRTASMRIGGVSIAGVAVTLDHDGIHVAGNSLFDRAVVQPALDLLLATLAKDGVTLRVDQTSQDGDLREATAFDLALAMPKGSLEISVGHVEAAAPDVAGTVARTPRHSVGTRHPAAARSPHPVGSTSVGAASPRFPTAAAPSGGAPGSGPPSMASVPASRRGVPAWLGVSPPAAVARALGTVFVLLLLGGMGMAAVPFVFMRRTRSVRSPSFPIPGGGQ